MLSKGSCLVVKDNSGFKNARCIQILKNPNHFKNPLARTVVIHGRILKRSQKKLKSRVQKAYVITSTKRVCRKSGNSVKFDENGIVLIRDANRLWGTELFGIFAKEARSLNVPPLNRQAKHFL